MKSTNTTYSPVLNFSLALLICLLTFGCQKKDSGQSDIQKLINDQIYKSKLIKNTVPSEAASYYLLTTNQLPDSPTTISDIKKHISEFQTTELSEVKSLLLNLLDTVPDQKINQVLNSAAIFQLNDYFGICIETKSPEMLRDITRKLATPTSKAGLDSNSITTAHNQNNLRLFIAKGTLNKRIEDAKSFCLDPKDSGFILPQYLEEKFLLNQTFAVGSFDKALFQSTALKSDPQYTDLLNQVPLEAIQVVKNFDKTYQIEFSGELTAKNAEQKESISLLQQIAEDPGTSGYELLKDSSTVGLVLNSSFIAKTLESAASEIPAEVAAELSELTSILQSSRTTAIAIAQPTIDAIFPDLSITLATSQAEALYISLQNFLQKLISSQVPMSNWLSKETQGVRFDYVQSPLGIGLYMAKLYSGSSISGIAISSSESGILNAANSSLPNLKNFLSDKGFHNLSTTAIVSGYVDFPRLSVLIDSVQGSLSLFTGGQSTLNNQHLANLKSFSLAEASINYEKPRLKLTVNYLPKK